MWRAVSPGWHPLGIGSCLDERGSLLVNRAALLSPSFYSCLINHLQLRRTLTSQAAKSRDPGDPGKTKKLDFFFLPGCLISFLSSFFPYLGALV